MIFQLAVPDGDVSRSITVALQGAVLVLALDAAGARRPVLLLAFGVAVTMAIGVGILLFTPGAVGPMIPRSISLLLLLLAPAAVVVGARDDFRQAGRVTAQTVFAGLCFYLLLGMAFAFVYGIIEAFSDVPFFANGVRGGPSDFLYFSLATLTTTGYGDLSAGTDVGRALSVTEALAGQIYLVTVVALLVGNLRRPAEAPADQPRS